MKPLLMGGASRRVLKVGAWVKTADGTEGRIKYIDGAGETQIYTKAGEYLSLPLSELRRAVETPQPPIEGMPTERPRCPYCDRPLRPNVRTTREMNPYRIVSRKFTGWNGYPITAHSLISFCTLSCARHFANAAWRAGYRITKKP